MSCLYFLTIFEVFFPKCFSNIYRLSEKTPPNSLLHVDSVNFPEQWTLLTSSVCMYVYEEQSEPWSGANLLDWDVEVLQPTTSPALKVGVLCSDQRSAELKGRKLYLHAASDACYLHFISFQLNLQIKEGQARLWTSVYTKERTVTLWLLKILKNFWPHVNTSSVIWVYGNNWWSLCVFILTLYAHADSASLCMQMCVLLDQIYCRWRLMKNASRSFSFLCFLWLKCSPAHSVFPHSYCKHKIIQIFITEEEEGKKQIKIELKLKNWLVDRQKIKFRYFVKHSCVLHYCLLVILSLAASRKVPSWDSWVSVGSCVLNVNCASVLPHLQSSYTAKQRETDAVKSPHQETLLSGFFYIYGRLTPLFLQNLLPMAFWNPAPPWFYLLLYAFNPSFGIHIFLPPFRQHFLLIPNPPQCSTPPDLL